MIKKLSDSRSSLVAGSLLTSTETKTIKMFIDGKECVGSKGDTILEVAKKNGIDSIPTLCWMKGLSSVGACRMCVVEPENADGKPSGRMLTACTSPAEEGMRINTSTEKLVSYRRQVLELLFAGRNHFCMFCSQSGDCDLQTRAIAHGMDSVRYPFLYAEFKNDTTDSRIQADHNRCILCQRCVRTCSEKVGACTLGLKGRGWATTVDADFGSTIGLSETCVECGACAQVCPTGTITLRDLAYRGRRKDCDAIVDTLCPICAIGCEIKVYVRTGSIVRVEGTNVDGPDGGQLCAAGRFGLPKSSEQPRITRPMIRSGSSFREASWAEALSLVAAKIRENSVSGKMGALISSLATDEELAVFASFKEAVSSIKMESYQGSVMRGFYNGAKSLADQGTRPLTAAHHILDSDAIVLVEADPQKALPVAASYIRVAVLHKGAKLIYVGKEKLFKAGTPFPGITDLEAEDLFDPKVKELLLDAKKPIFVLGSAPLSDDTTVSKILNFAIERGAFFGDGLGIVPLLGHSNALGSLNTVMALDSWLEEEQDFLYVYSTGLVQESPKALSAMSSAGFTVVQTPFMLSPLTNLADVILPAPAWFERSGHLCTLEGERRRVSKIIDPIPGLKGFGEVLQIICGRLGLTMKAPSTVPRENTFQSRATPDPTQPSQAPDHAGGPAVSKVSSATSVTTREA
ncbi:MAG: molybdopterin-dependent oxidoreductase [Synergistaceae bacterium]|jgi:formate dehydrogenase major subunit|nr:molybdopterin-dependent oxidoreductase [Synergistaceae bacterium]